MIRHLPSHDATPWTAADLLERVGDVPLYRIRSDPAPGTATEEDLLRVNESKEALCELVDGVLVEKAMGNEESLVASELVYLLKTYLRESPLGVVFCPDAEFRLTASKIRLPDVAFVPRQRVPQADKSGKQPAIWDLTPDLAIEVISRGNTKSEMEGKLREYFEGGAKLVWYIYPRSREVHVFAAFDDCRILNAADTLDGGDVLPGFRLPLRQLFEEIDRQLGRSS
jgi:Uma2 family endonuclease